MASNSKTIYTPAGYAGTLSITATFDANGNISATGKLVATNTAWGEYPQCALRIKIDGTTQKQIAVPHIDYKNRVEFGGTNTATVSYLGGAWADGNHTITCEFYNPYTPNYIYYTSSISVTLNVSTKSKATLSFSKTSVTVEETLGITITKHIIEPTSLTWECLGASGDVGLLSSGNWQIPTNIIEPLMRNTTSATITFKLTTPDYGEDIKTVTVTIPSNYLPTISLGQLTTFDTSNGKLLGGISHFSIPYTLGKTPSNNTAEVVKINMVNVSLTPSFVSEFSVTIDKGTNLITSSNVPLPSHESNIVNYNMTITFQVEDSRGRTNTVSLGAETLGTIFSYIIPNIALTKFERCDGNGGLKVDGTYIYTQVDMYDLGEQLTIHKLDIEGISDSFNLVQSTSDPRYWEVVGGKGLLVSDQQYMATISIQTKSMQNFGIAPIIISNIISTMQMPMSWHDDGDQVGVSFGEQAQHYSDVDTKSVVNFSRLTTLRAYDEDGNVVTCSPYDLIFAVKRSFYPVGAIIYSSTLDNENSVIEVYGGIHWTMIEGVMLLGASDTHPLNETGGEETHTLTVEEMPSHAHNISTEGGSVGHYNYVAGASGSSGTPGNRNTQSTGGGGAHNNMPPYRSVYIWERIE